MAITIRINGDDYLVADGTLQTSLQLGLGGSQLQFGLVTGQGYPPLLKKVILSLAGIDFEGKLTDDGRDSANTHIGTRTYTAIGQQYRLDRNTDIEFRGLTSVTDILDEMLFSSGVPGTVVGTTRNLRGYRFKGPLKAGLQDLAIKGKYMLFLAPDRVELIDREDPPAAPFNWIYGSTSGWRNFNPRKSSERPYNRIVVEGGVPKKSDSDPDEEEIEVPYAGDGIRKRFGYPRTTDEVFDLTVDGTSKTICQEGDPEQASFDAYNDRGNYDVVFATAPAAGTEVILSCRIQRARGVWNDTASQAEEAEDGGDGILELVKSMPEIRTQLEAQEAAEALGAVIGVPKVEASAEVWAQEGIFWPGRTVVQSWPAEAWNETLPVQQTTLTYRSDLEGWIQQVSTGNGKDGEVSGSATGFSSGSLGGGSGNQITEKLPPTETSQAGANLPKFLSPYDIVRGEDGMYYLGDGNVIRSLDVANNILDTYAGDGSSDVTGDGGLATSAGLGSVVRSIGMDQYFNLYLFSSNYTVRKIDYSTKIITTFAGNGTEGNTGNGGAATDAQLVNVSDIIERPSTGEILIGQGQYPIRRVNGTGIIEEFVTLNVGNGEGALSIIHIGADVYICTDITSRKIYQFDALGNIIHLAGTGGDGYTGDGGLAVDAEIGSPWGIIGDGSGNYYFSDYSNSVVRKISSGIITTVAGTGTIGYSGDNGPGTSADLCNPIGLEIYLDGDLYLLICDSGNACIRKLNLVTGIISLFAGTPQVFGYSGDGGPLK